MDIQTLYECLIRFHYKCKLYSLYLCSIFGLTLFWAIRRGYIIAKKPGIPTDASNIIQEAVRISEAGSLKKMWYVMMHPNQVQPPLRSVPVAIFVEFWLGTTSIHLLEVFYYIWLMLCYFVFLALLVGILWSLYGKQIASLLILPLILVHTISSPLNFSVNYTILALPTAIITLFAATRVSRNKSIWSRRSWATVVAVTAWITALIDTEPAFVVTYLAAFCYLFGDDFQWKTLLGTGSLGVILFIPVLSKAILVFSNTTDQYFLYISNGWLDNVDTVMSLLVSPSGLLLTISSILVLVLGIRGEKEIDPLVGSIIGFTIVITPTYAIVFFDPLVYTLLLWPLVTAEAVVQSRKQINRNLCSSIGQTSRKN